MRCCDAGKRRLLQGLPPMRNVGGHASQRDTSHVCATYMLLRRREASPPTYRPVGELSGEVLAKHLTIRNARQQRALVHFGEVLGR